MAAPIAVRRRALRHQLPPSPLATLGDWGEKSADPKSSGVAKGQLTATTPVTPEQLEAARLRDEPFHELKRQLDAGEITAHEHLERWNQLITEIHGDPGDFIQVNSGKD